ncbi:MAG TPA: hypothetical protein VF798_03895 [Burkholderiaceae bacterium]
MPPSIETPPGAIDMRAKAATRPIEGRAALPVYRSILIPNQRWLGYGKDAPREAT